MRVRVLGSVEVRTSAGWVSPAPRQRTLLALLLAGRGAAIPVERLAEEIWGADQPSDPAGQVYIHVARVRRSLGDSDGKLLRTWSRAYSLDVANDMAEFERLAGKGAYAEALAVWRGEAFADAGESPMVQAETSRLNQLRLDVLEGRVDADLAEGRHHELVAELEATASEHSLREHFWRQLMLALYRCGRQAEALATYQQVHRILDEELGIRPGPELSKLHQQILENDPVLDPPPVSSRRVPWQLPPVADGFTGREDLLTRIGDSPVTVISGMGGIGKTALAVYWGHQQGEGRFPDGHYYVDLHGYGSDDPLTPRAAMEGVCRALGAEDLPVESEQLAGLYRSMLAGRRMLLVLDNARSVDQVRPLLPGREGCTTVVTSRDDLAGLVARDGAVRVQLDGLVEAEADELLNRILGADRTATDPEACAGLIRVCAGLPLAFRIAAERAQHRPGTPLADLLAEFAESPRLDALDVPGDPNSALRTVFSWSHDQLTPADARLFGLLGLHPGSHFDSRIAANLADTDLPTVRKQLDTLSRAHLIEPWGAAGRYRMHDLIRAYAAELESDDEGAFVRLLNYYLHATEAATDILNPDRVRIPHEIPPPTTPPPTFTGEQHALDWLETENDTIAVIIRHAANAGYHRYPWRICNAVWLFYHFTAQWDNWLSTHSAALASAQATRDLIGEAWTTTRLGTAHGQIGGDHDEAVRCHARAVRLFHAAGDRVAEAQATYNLAQFMMLAGRHAEAGPEAERAVTMFHELGETVDEAIASGLVVEVHAETELTSGHLERCRSALNVLRREGARHATSSLVSTLGIAHRIVGDFDLAIRLQLEASAAYKEIGDRESAAMVGYRLAEIYLAGGSGAEAARCASCALQPFPPTRVNLRAAVTALLALAAAHARNLRASAEHAEEAALLLRDQPADVEHTAAHQYVGETHLALGDLEAAEAHLRQALHTADTFGLTRRRGLARRALGDLATARSNHRDASHHWKTALRDLSRAGATADADEVRARLMGDLGLPADRSMPAPRAGRTRSTPVAAGRSSITRGSSPTTRSAESAHNTSPQGAL